MSASRLSGWGKYATYLCVATLSVLLVMEIALRVFWGKPEGYFYHRPLDGSTLYLPSRTMRMAMGPIPYTVKTNALGFRGPEITKEKPAGVFRVVAIGDSVTDGFYVDNADTYPVRLEVFLGEAGHRVEVVNAARGNASIDTEYYILRQFASGLSPDAVLLTFVTNDIDDIRGRTKEELIGMNGVDYEPSAKSEALIFARTALGEMLLDWSLKSGFDNYRAYERMEDGAEIANRYTIPGARDFETNVARFMTDRVKPNDSILGYDTLTENHLGLIENYLFALGHLKGYLANQGTELAFVYVPGYNQVHDLQSGAELPERLAAGCAALGVPFLDLTDAFRDEVREHVLHLAPVDYHMTPYGNEVMARAVGEFLEERFLDVRDGVAEKR